MSSWFSRLVALLGLRPHRPDPGACILLGGGRGVSWSEAGGTAGSSLSGATPPPAR